MLPYTLLAELVVILCLCVGSAYSGYRYEANSFDKFKSQIISESKVQQAAVTKINSENMHNDTISLENYKTGVNNITAYYRNHPVTVIRLQHDGNTCSMSSPISDTERVNGASESSVPVTYNTQYEPEVVEKMSAQLNTLQRLLISDGVIVE